MHNYIIPLVELFQQNADAVNAKPMAKYMKNLFPYLGIKTPERRELLKQFYKEYGKPEINELKQISRDLWELPEREFQYWAVGMLQLYKNKVDASFIELYEKLIITKSWFLMVFLYISFHSLKSQAQFPWGIHEKWEFPSLILRNQDYLFAGIENLC